MKKLILVCLLAIAATAYAAWTPQTFRLQGSSTVGTSYLLVFDSASVKADSLRADTVYSDTVDISDATRLCVYLQLGAVTKATHGNDSVTIRMNLMTDAQSPYSGGYSCASDTFGGNNITTIDEATRRINLLLDTVPARRVWMRTILSSRVDSVFGSAVKETTLIPLNYYMLTR